MQEGQYELKLKPGCSKVKVKVTNTPKHAAKESLITFN